MPLWTDGTHFSVGDCPAGWREATEEESSALDLQQGRMDKRREAITKFDVEVSAGVAYGGKVLQIDDEARGNITGASAQAIASLLPGSPVSWPQGFGWRMLDNTYLSVPDAPAMLALGAAAATRYAALRLRLGQLKDAIDAASDMNTLNSIDVTTGWD
jgi:hypothetical protein